jgi:putative Mn2+ efflux pump MntP
MKLLDIIIIAVGLSMDAFAVSIVLGLSVEKPKLREMLIPGVFFGGFQALMPITGYFAGFYFAGRINAFEHWIAFVLLGIIGGKMIKESLSKNREEPKEYSFQLIKMLGLAIATSIDAFAVGVTFAFFKNTPIFRAAVIIGSITFFFSIAGVKIGNIFGTKFKSKAEFAGGVVLVLLGVKIVIERLFF